jgi:uncharacterized protein (DUF305 family)
MKPFALPLLIGVTIGVISTGVMLLARDDFYWYRNAYDANSVNTSVDAAFIENMIPHHEGAIAMAELALTKAKTKEVQTLAANIIKNQQEEITTIKAWYTTWFERDVPEDQTNSSMINMSDNDMAAMHTETGTIHMNSMSGDLEALQNAKDFDKEFVTQMIPHHEMAVMMAQMLLRTSSREEMKTLAQNIIDSQSKEIADMQSWLTMWE